MSLEIVVSPARVARRFLAGVLALVAIGAAVQTSIYGFGFYEEWMDMLNLDREMNLPTWYSALMLATSAALLAGIARLKRLADDRYAREWKLLAAIYTFLAVDEVFSIHEIFIIPEVAESLDLPLFLHSMWVIPGAIFVTWVAWRFWPFVRDLPGEFRRLFLMAAGVYVGGALAMETIGSHVAQTTGRQTLLYAQITTAEEAMEMFGVVIFIYALLCYLRSLSPRLPVQVTFFGGAAQSQADRAEGRSSVGG